MSKKKNDSQVKPALQVVPFGLWNVSGTVIIPGSRKNGKFGPIRISAKDRTHASAQLAPLLNEKFKTELRGVNSFSEQFALMNLQWSEIAPIHQA